MSKYFRPPAWSQLVAGIAMLVAIALPVLIKMSNEIGLGKTFGTIVVGLLVAVWILVGVILIVRGLNKM